MAVDLLVKVRNKRALECTGKGCQLSFVVDMGYNNPVMEFISGIAAGRYATENGLLHLLAYYLTNGGSLIWDNWTVVKMT